MKEEMIEIGKEMQNIARFTFGIGILAREEVVVVVVVGSSVEASNVRACHLGHTVEEVFKSPNPSSFRRHGSVTLR